MKSLNKTISIYLVFAIILSIGFPCGILGIIFGATNSMTWLLVLGIVLVVLGFYGAPMVWIKYGEYKTLRSTLFAIENDNIYSTGELALQLNKNEKTIVNEVNKLIEKRFLTGMLFKDKSRLEVNNNRKAGHKIKCPNCGALMESGDMPECPYCGYRG